MHYVKKSDQTSGVRGTLLTSWWVMTCHAFQEQLEVAAMDVQLHVLHACFETFARVKRCRVRA